MALKQWQDLTTVQRVLAHLNVIVEDQVVISVSVQQWMGIGHVEILKLQHSIWPSPHHCFHKLINHLHASRHEACMVIMLRAIIMVPSRIVEIPGKNTAKCASSEANGSFCLSYKRVVTIEV